MQSRSGFETPDFTLPGFTLMELLVVVAIIAILAAVAMPSLTSYFNVSLNSATRDLAGITKEAYNSAIISGHVYRLAYDLKTGEYWAESGPQPTAQEFLLDTAESLEKDKHRRRFTSPAASPSPGTTVSFTLDRAITRKKISLPRGVTFEDVLTQQNADPITDGTAYTHFFPQGLTEQAVVHLKDASNHHQSLVIAPLSGRTDLYDHYVTRQDAFGK